MDSTVNQLGLLVQSSVVTVLGRAVIERSTTARSARSTAVEQWPHAAPSSSTAKVSERNGDS